MNARILLLILASVATVGVAYGQPQPANGSGTELPRPRYGLLLGAGGNLHSADFKALPGIPNCCGGFESGFGIGPTAGLLYELSLSPTFSLSLRGAYTAQNALLSRDEETFVEMNGEAVPVTIEHTIDAALGSVGIEPVVGYRLNDRMSILGGARIGFNIAKEFTQQEKLGENVTRGTFENGKRVRQEFSGEIPGASAVQGALLAGVGYELPLNTSGTFMAAPELLFSFGLTPIADGLTWSSHAIRAGVALKYSPLPAVAEPEPVVVAAAPPPPPPKPLLTAAIGAVGIAADNSEEQVVRLRVEEFVATEIRPLLNYIFFDEGANTIPLRYARIPAGGTGSFNLESFYGKGTLAVYRDILNIIGKRLADNPNVRIRLVGTGADEGGGTEGARARAEAVRDYLRDVWGIAERRIRVESRTVPEKPSNTAYADGVAENRRVEIYPDAPMILSPVTTSDTTRTATPPTIQFRTSVRSEAGVAEWRITARQEARTLHRIRGEGPVPEKVEWPLATQQSTIPNAPGIILYSLEVNDKAGQRFESPVGSMPVEQLTVRKKRSERIADTEVERYSLIVFDYDKADLTDEHRQVIRTIREKISPESLIRIRGFADRTGDAAHNQELSLQRARAVAKALGVPEERIDVAAAAELLYNNDLPEGRFYSRTVTIEIETPVVEGDAG